MQENRFGILNGNHLKLIAAFTMLLDHAGILLFPRVQLFRILGRLAYPIFAFMIAEGCRYTRNKLRYFLMVFGLGAACQLVYYFVGGDTYLNILLTFSCSILLIYALQTIDWVAKQNWWVFILWTIGFFAVVMTVFTLENYLTFDYGIWGIMTPVFASLPLKKGEHEKYRILLLGIALLCLAADLGTVQWYSLLSVPLLLLYNGQRGKANMKYFFYIFYPVHLAVLQGIAWLVR